MYVIQWSASLTRLFHFQNITQCSKHCCHGRNCVSDTSIGEMINLRTLYWNAPDNEAPGTKERALRTTELFKACEVCDGVLSFKLSNRKVCEAGMLNLLGLFVSKNYSEANNQWKRLKKEFLNGTASDGFSEKDAAKDFSNDFQAKAGHATAYIHKVANTFSDSTPTSDFAKNNEVKVLPYDDVKSFYVEYRANCGQEHLVAKETCFRAAFGRMNDEVKLLGCKGSFQTCEICNNSNDLLTDSGRRWTESQRIIVLHVTPTCSVSFIYRACEDV